MDDEIWKMTADGDYMLQEPYKSQLLEAKNVASEAWFAGLTGYLEPECAYTAEELTDELNRRIEKRTDESKSTILDEFVLEALSGDF